MQEPGVIVGVDGCDACQAALRYAIEEADRRGCGLALVVAYDRAGASAPWNTGAAGEDPSAEAVARARQRLEQAEPTVPPGHAVFEIVTEEMPPADALAAAARNAVAIVVGRHHEEPAGGNSTGSTTNRLREHSPVPVISVPRGYR